MYATEVRLKDAKQRVYEQPLSTNADLRELIAYLSVELLKANREGRFLSVECWSSVEEPRPNLGAGIFDPQ